MIHKNFMLEEILVGSIIGIYAILLQIMKKLGKLEERVNIIFKFLRLNSVLNYDKSNNPTRNREEGTDFKRFERNN